MRATEIRAFGCCVLLLAMCGIARVEAQDIQPALSHLVRIESDPAGAEVYRGDSLLGRTPLRIPLADAAGIVLYYPERISWNAQRKELGASPLPEHLGVMLVRFQRTIRVRSLPHGAAVFRGDSLLGRTPIDLPADTATLTIQAVGYSTEALRPSDVENDAVLVRLEAVSYSRPAEFEVRSDVISLPGADILLPAGVGLAAGIVAVILKQYADARYDDYLATRDEKLLSEAKKYDIYAGISLAVLQLGLGYFVVRLFEE